MPQTKGRRGDRILKDWLARWHKLWLSNGLMLSLIWQAAGQVSHIQMSGMVNLRDSAYFKSGVSRNITGTLPPDTVGEIIAYGPLDYGVGVQIQVNQLADQYAQDQAYQGLVGKTGWVYYPFSSDSRFLTLMDSSGGLIDTGSASFFDFFKKANLSIDKPYTSKRRTKEKAEGRAPAVVGNVESLPENPPRDDAGPVGRKPAIVTAPVVAEISHVEPKQWQSIDRDQAQKKLGAVKYIKITQSAPVAMDYNPETKESYWKKIKGGFYTIDIENYDGGPFVPIWVEEVNADGDNIKRRLYVKRDLNEMLEVFAQPEVALGESLHPKIDCHPDLVATVFAATEELVEVEEPKRDESGWVEGCQILKEKPLKDGDADQLHTCFNNILSKVNGEDHRQTNGRLDRNKVFSSLFKKLNSYEQDFIGKTLVSIGETGMLSRHGLQEMHAVMKVVDNRVRMAREQKNNPRIGSLDIILQPWQFSPFNDYENDNLEPWRKIMGEDGKVFKSYQAQQKRAIQAFISYPSAQFKPPEEGEQITFFCSTTTSANPPKWAKGSSGHGPARSIGLTIDDRQVLGLGNKKGRKGRDVHFHQFYTNEEIERVNPGKRAFVFQANPWKK